MRYSEKRLAAIRKAPPIQYPSRMLLGGMRSAVTTNHPSSMRIMLLIDSERTSRNGTSLVRMGSTLYMIPMTSSQTIVRVK